MNNPLVQVDPGLFIWTIATFLVLLTLLAKFAWGPLLKALESRQQSIRQALDDALKAINTRLNDQSEANRRSFAEQKSVIDTVSNDLRIVSSRAASAWSSGRQANFASSVSSTRKVAMVQMKSPGSTWTSGLFMSNTFHGRAEARHYVRQAPM